MGSAVLHQPFWKKLKNPKSIRQTEFWCLSGKIQNTWTVVGSHIANGLAFMHAHGKVHRGLKPCNGIPFSGVTKCVSPLLTSNKLVEVD